MVKKSSFLWCILLVWFPSALWAQYELSPAQKRQYALDLLKEYDPEGHYVITQVNSISRVNPFDRYAEGNRAEHVREALGTMVHELNHGYSALMAWKLRPKEPDSFFCYYMGGTTYTLVQRTPVFPTEEMGKTIAKNLQTFRFETYVYNPDEKIKLTSSVLGIYGLLDEWVAYYHGTVTDVNMHKWYLTNTKGTIRDWYNYFSNVGSVITAYVEFKFFCLAYLAYAQQHYPELYRRIMENQAFVDVFLTVDERYQALVNQYGQIKDGILDSLRKKGVKVSEDDEWIVMNGQGVGNFTKEFKLLEKEIGKPVYQEIMQALQTSLTVR